MLQNQQQAFIVESTPNRKSGLSNDGRNPTSI
jgi:hypothetical protein